MVSLRRRRLLGLCSGNNSFVTPLPLHCENLYENLGQQANPKREHTVFTDVASPLDSVGTQTTLTDVASPQDGVRIQALNSQNTIVKDEPGLSDGSGSTSSEEQPIQQIIGPPVKRRKQYSRKVKENKEPYMRGVYNKNMKWQAAIKVDKKQIHLGTVASQEEAAHLYDRAAFMCGRETNFELPNNEKLELSKLTWEEFLATTRQAIAMKRRKCVLPNCIIRST